MNPTISVAIIAKDEEPYIYDCIQSIIPIADEIILVDTGSKDRTAEIAQEFGARIYNFNWDNDYAAARNESLKYCNGDWIFQIDPDERLRPTSVDLVLDVVKRQRCLMSNVTIHNEGRPLPEGDQVPRLFRNIPGIKYFRRYHETVCNAIHEIEEKQPWKRWYVYHDKGIVLDHVGNSRRPPQEMEQKNLRAVYLMVNWMRENPFDSYIARKLVVCYSLIQHWHPAVMRDIRANQGNLLLHVLGKKQEAWAAFSGALSWEIEYQRQLKEQKQKQEKEKASGYNNPLPPSD